MRELGLPRDAIVSLLVRDEQALLPRGSTRIEAGDRLHVLVRREVSNELPDLLDRWRDGPVGRAAAPAAPFSGTVPIYTARPWDDADGDPSHPEELARPRRSSSTCARGATCPARWSCSRTAATR